VYATDAKAYCYQQRPNSITSDDKESSQSKRQSDRLGVIVRLQRLCDKLSQDDRLALQRRIAQLTMDSIYQVIIENHSRKALDEHLESLRSEGLFPLPDRNYSTKYVWFRRMTNTAVGRALLLHSLPLLKKER